MPKKEGDIRIRCFGFDHPGGGAQEVFKIGRADDGLVKVGREADDVQFFYEVSLCCNEIVAQDINLLRLLLALFIELLDEQTQSFISLFIIGYHLSFWTPNLNVSFFQYFQFGSTKGIL
ncbi:hypothetical protein ACFL5Z_10055 [Planctomycetota bacterium]